MLMKTRYPELLPGFHFLCFNLMSLTWSIMFVHFQESDDFDAAPQVWCKVTCFERESPRGEFFIDRPLIIVDGSDNAFDVTR